MSIIICRDKNEVGQCAAQRKARGALEGPIGPTMPSSILRTHSNCKVYLDPASSSLLKRRDLSGR
jgi:hypothetical protein